MSGKQKTLLIHDDLQTNRTVGIVVDEKDVVQKTKAFLKNLAKKYKQATVDVYSPVGIVLKPVDTNEAYAVAYEKEKFVIVVPNGTHESAKLYGNWHEAIVSAQRILNSPKKAARFLLAQYVIETK